MVNRTGLDFQQIDWGWELEKVGRLFRIKCRSDSCKERPESNGVRKNLRLPHSFKKKF